MNWILIKHIAINLLLYASLYATWGVLRPWKTYDYADRSRAIACVGILLTEWFVLVSYTILA